MAAMNREYSGVRMLLVHAHPDDETITTGGTIARYAAEGAEVTVVTCTLGEEGEVIGDRWAGLAADRADQLGGYRIGELTEALRILGGIRPRFLGGAGRWRDSGMAGTASADRPRAFVNADEDEAVGELAGVIRDTRPHIVITYDPDGGYGHPDHIRAHKVTMAAVKKAAGDWKVGKVYWTFAEANAVEAGLAEMHDVPEGWAVPVVGELPVQNAPAMTTEIDISGVLDRKRDALAAHGTQVQVAPNGGSYALSNMIAQPVVDKEFFMLVQGLPGPINREGRETDLAAGLNLIEETYTI